MREQSFLCLWMSFEGELFFDRRTKEQILVYSKISWSIFKIMSFCSSML